MRGLSDGDGVALGDGPGDERLLVGHDDAETPRAVGRAFDQGVLAQHGTGVGQLAHVDVQHDRGDAPAVLGHLTRPGGKAQRARRVGVLGPLVPARLAEAHARADPIDPERAQLAARGAVSSDEVPGTEAEDQTVALDGTGPVPIGEVRNLARAHRLLQRREVGQGRQHDGGGKVRRRIGGELVECPPSEIAVETHRGEREGKRFLLLVGEIEVRQVVVLW